MEPDAEMGNSFDHARHAALRGAVAAVLLAGFISATGLNLAASAQVAKSVDNGTNSHAGGKASKQTVTTSGTGAAPLVADATPVTSKAGAAGKVSFVPATFADLLGWAADDHLAALKTFRTSCPRVVAAVKAGNKAGAHPPPAELLAACTAAMALPAKVSRAGARAFFERSFTPQRVVHAAGQGLLTGYYEPLLEGSRKREGRFLTPIHKRPTDLVTLVAETDRATVGKAFTHARQTKKGPMPFATRAEIDAGALDGQGLELLYLADSVEVFFLQIQGSGRVKLPDGLVVRVNYDGKNGHPYTSIGRYLIETGILAADRVSLAALAAWLRADAARGRSVMHQNASYVFFRELPAGSEGPLGVLEIPLTAGRSLAVDPSVHVLGSPVFVSAPTLTHAVKGQPFNRLMVAQDVGSAIKGPERGDIYFGSGDAAGKIAGVTKHPGHLFVLKARAIDSSIPTGSLKAPAATRKVP